MSFIVGSEHVRLPLSLHAVLPSPYASAQTHAYPADELMPISCKGRVRGREPGRGDVDDALGHFSLTLVDTLDSLAVSGEVE